MPAKVEKNFDLGDDFARAVLFVKRELEEIGLDMRDEMIDVMRAEDARATGDLIAATQSHVEGTPGESQGLRLTVGPDAKPGSRVAFSRQGVAYGPFVDEDTKPHWPPPRALERWARAKFGATGREKKEIAFLVGRAISRRGTQGINFTGRTMDAFKGDIVPRLQRAMTRAFATSESRSRTSTMSRALSARR